MRYRRTYILKNKLSHGWKSDGYPTKRLCILFTINLCSGADYALFWCSLGQIFIKFVANQASKYFFINAETASSNLVTLVQKHQKEPYLMLDANKGQI